jgi:hypothetical protein
LILSVLLLLSLLRFLVSYHNILDNKNRRAIIASLALIL